MADRPAPAAWLPADTVRDMARLLRALRTQAATVQANDPQAIGQAVLASRAAFADLTDLIQREGFDAVANAPAIVPTPATFTERAFVAWWCALARRGLADGELLLAWHIWAWVWLAPPAQGDAVAAFLEALAALDPPPDPTVDAATLRELLTRPAPKRRRGRPPGRHPQAAAADEAVARELFEKRQAEGILTVPDCDPWHVLQNLAAVIDEIIATDRGITNTSHLQGEEGPDNRLIKAWLGTPQRRLPSLRRRLVIEALAKHCLTWWIAEHQAESGHLPRVSSDGPGTAGG